MNPLLVAILRILDALGLSWLFSSAVRPQVDQGLGTVSISADTAMDAAAPAPTDLIAAAGVDGLSIFLRDYRSLNQGDTFVLIPPDGFEFVGPLPSVRVGGGRTFDPEDPEASGHAEPIEGAVQITSAGHLQWTATGPRPPGLEGGGFFVSVGRDAPLLVQPVRGQDASAGGEIQVQSTAFMLNSSVITQGVGRLELAPGRANTSESTVELDPDTIVSDGRDTTTVTIHVLDQFGTATDDVGTVAATQDPASGSFDGGPTRQDVGRHTVTYSSETPGAVRIGAQLDGSGVLGDRVLTVLRTADLHLSITADGDEPPVGSEVTLTLEVRNDGEAPAAGVTVNAPVPESLDLVGAVVTAGAGAVNTVDGDISWTGIELDVGAVATADVIATVVGSVGNGIDFAASIVASDDVDAGGAHTGDGDDASITLFPA